MINYYYLLFFFGASVQVYYPLKLSLFVFIFNLPVESIFAPNMQITILVNSIRPNSGHGQVFLYGIVCGWVRLGI